jgi:cystathionine beta-lyase
MKYNFETSPEMPGQGNINYVRWPKKLKEKGIESYRGACMHFSIAPQIVEAFKTRAEGTFGYTQVDDAYVEAVLGWMKTRRHWDAKKESLYNYFGTMQAIITAFRAFSNPGDGVIQTTPIYYMYKYLIERNQRQMVIVPLKQESSTYHFDLPALEFAMQKKENKILLICNPNNPTGTVWPREELVDLTQLAKKYGVVVISDEIFAELTFPGFLTTPLVACCEDAGRAITITSLGKVFNLMGQPHSNVFIEDPETRERFIDQATTELMRDMDAFMYSATIAAYTQCGEWLDEVQQLIVKHYGIWKEFLCLHLPQVKIFPPQSTYLLWIDWRGLGLNDDELEKFLFEEADIAIDRGDLYGPGGEGFTRTNIAMPTRDLEAMLSRLLKAAHSRGFAKCEPVSMPFEFMGNKSQT